MSEHQKNNTSPLLLGLGALAGLIGGWITYSNRLIQHDLHLPDAINAPRERFLGKRTTRFMNYYHDTEGSGKPLVLVHSINAAGSAYEMRPIFQHYRGTRPVYALELPGFGFSERSDRSYSYMLYKDAILDFVTDVVGEPVDLVALSLSCEFAARAALEQPDSFHSLVMISPSGFTSRENKVASQKASQNNSSDTAYQLFANPLWSQAFYDLLATRVSIRYFLRQSFEGPIDEGLAAYGYVTTHQPGARYAPLYFVSGKLFSPFIREDVYEHLELPVLVIYDRDNFVSFDTLPNLVVRRDNWQVSRVAPTKGLPHFEETDKTIMAMSDFWLETV